jgi:hypothetical protein
MSPYLPALAVAWTALAAWGLALLTYAALKPPTPLHYEYIEAPVGYSADRTNAILANGWEYVTTTGDGLIVVFRRPS